MVQLFAVLQYEVNQGQSHKKYKGMAMERWWVGSLKPSKFCVIWTCRNDELNEQESNVPASYVVLLDVWHLTLTFQLKFTKLHANSARVLSWIYAQRSGDDS